MGWLWWDDGKLMCQPDSLLISGPVLEQRSTKLYPWAASPGYIGMFDVWQMSWSWGFKNQSQVTSPSKRLLFRFYPHQWSPVNVRPVVLETITQAYGIIRGCGQENGSSNSKKSTPYRWMPQLPQDSQLVVIVSTSSGIRLPCFSMFRPSLKCSMLSWKSETLKLSSDISQYRW